MAHVFSLTLTHSLRLIDEKTSGFLFSFTFPFKCNCSIFNVINFSFLFTMKQTQIEAHGLLWEVEKIGHLCNTNFPVMFFCCCCWAMLCWKVRSCICFRSTCLSLIRFLWPEKEVFNQPFYIYIYLRTLLDGCAVPCCPETLWVNTNSASGNLSTKPHIWLTSDFDWIEFLAYFLICLFRLEIPQHARFGSLLYYFTGEIRATEIINRCICR